MVVSGSHLLDDSPLVFSSVISLRYALPEILANGDSHSVNFKFQTLGHFVNVCGSLSDDVRSRLHFVCLDKCKYVRPLEFMLANSEAKGSVNDGEDILFGSEVFEVWKMVKDWVALPLLIDLCEKAGFDLPPCFLHLYGILLSLPFAHQLIYLQLELYIKQYQIEQSPASMLFGMSPWQQVHLERSSSIRMEKNLAFPFSFPLLTDVLPPFVAFAQAFVVVLTAILTSSLYYMDASPKGKEWIFQFRFWPNNNSKMYVLEGVTPCIQSMQLQAGDIGKTLS
ncbi:B3 domain-containing protein [Glycine soja]|uniref:B3 domain-containing protein n=1 Tax=Glycine soja TaxID=3848 RepID=A0A445IZD0_GLYSO|nr:B3 domain-containing protein [Glycine soja]